MESSYRQSEVIPDSRGDDFVAFIRNPDKFIAEPVEEEEEGEAEDPWTEDSQIHWYFSFSDNEAATADLRGWFLKRPQDEKGDLYIEMFGTSPENQGYGKLLLRYLRQYPIFESIETYGGDTDEGKGFWNLMWKRGLIGLNLVPLTPWPRTVEPQKTKRTQKKQRSRASRINWDDF